MELIVSDISAWNIVGNHVQAVGQVGAGSTVNLLPVDESGWRHGPGIHRFRRFCDDNGFALLGKADLEMHDGSCARGGYERLLLNCEPGVLHTHDVLARGDGRKLE